MPVLLHMQPVCQGRQGSQTSCTETPTAPQGEPRASPSPCLGLGLHEALPEPLRSSGPAGTRSGKWNTARDQVLRTLPRWAEAA